jgi:signal transduction histidine kinase
MIMSSLYAGNKNAENYGMPNNANIPVDRHKDLQAYVAWCNDDALRVQSLGELVEPDLPALIEDFYAEIEKHPEARQVITGGAEQIGRLKLRLLEWIRELFLGKYDADYFVRRWRVGYRHVEIGLRQAYTNVALARLRHGLAAIVHRRWQGSDSERNDVLQSLNKLLDLDLAIIQDAYETAFMNRLQSQERLAALGQVAGGVAHELRNPLNVVKTSVYYLRNAQNPPREKTLEHLGRIERQVGVADGVISTLSDFAKLPTPQREEMSLEQCLEEALTVDRPPDGILLDWERSLVPTKVLGDLRQLRIVFGNLLRNAQEAMPQGGKLGIHVLPDGDRVRVAISDTGVGITSENIRRLMEPFFTTKARGIGLGLALARSIVDKNQGKLTVTSQPGLGSTFTVDLLAADPEAGLTR